MMALTKPMNQPSVAKPGGGSLTWPEGESPSRSEAALSPSSSFQDHGLVCKSHLEPVVSPLTTPLPSGTRQVQGEGQALRH